MILYISNTISINNKSSIGICTLFLLFPIWAYGGGLGGLTRALKTPSEKTPDIKRAVTFPAQTIDEHFNRTLDEILETKGISRGDIPEHVINKLRDATEDPLKLIDGSLDINIARFFGTRVHDPNFNKYMDIYRAFFQKRLDLSNTEQMERLSDLVDDLWKRLMPKSDDLNTPHYSVLYALTKHSGLSPDEFDVWYADLYTALFNRDRFFKEIAEKALKEGFDGKTFFHHWEDEAFRKFIVDSHFMTKTHLTGNPDLLIRWTDELEQQEQGLEQFSALIRSSFEGTDNLDDVARIVDNDPFFVTVTQASREDTTFSRRTQPLLRENIPFNTERKGEKLSFMRLMGAFNVGEWS